MNNEIKEILDYLKEYVETSKKETNKYKDGYIIYPTELGFIHCIKLLDYITNLQQKVDQYENPEDMTLFYMWLDAKAKDKMKQLQEENKKLKETNVYCNRTDCSGRIKDSKKYDSLLQKYEELQQENERLTQGVTLLTNKLIDITKENERLKENAINNDKVVDKAKWNEMLYKSRCEKAIEYNKQIIKALLTCTSYEKDKVEDMLYEQQNILQGEDKDVEDKK